MSVVSPSGHKLHVSTGESSFGMDAVMELDKPVSCVSVQHYYKLMYIPAFLMSEVQVTFAHCCCIA